MAGAIEFLPVLPKWRGSCLPGAGDDGREPGLEPGDSTGLWLSEVCESEGPISNLGTCFLSVCDVECSDPDVGLVEVWSDVDGLEASWGEIL
jgi:hypothetical protein